MTEYTARIMRADELKEFHKHIKEDFPVGEYPPYEVLCRQFRDGLQEGLVFCKGEQVLAYSICAAGTDYILLSLFAVFPEFRGQGIGIAFLEALVRNYFGRIAIIVEVERPESAKKTEEINLRKRRIKFYERAGFYLIPGIDYEIWDIPMHLMALPMNSSKAYLNEQIQPIMYRIYVKLTGEQLIHKMRLNKVTTK